MAHESDDPKKMVEGICLRYSLDDNQKAILINQIQDGIECEVRLMQNKGLGEMADIEADEEAAITVPTLSTNLHKRAKDIVAESLNHNPNNAKKDDWERVVMRKLQQKAMQANKQISSSEEASIKTPEDQRKISRPQGLVSRLTDKKESVKKTPPKCRRLLIRDEKFNSEPKRKDRGVYLHSEGLNEKKIEEMKDISSIKRRQKFEKLRSAQAHSFNQKKLGHLRHETAKELNDHANVAKLYVNNNLSLIHICRCRRYAVCRSRWSPYH
eukprot:TRINITY_DN2199_c0_g3_i1.p1 TRINITY_DN2199_c0_g3~~TRINITY_DN2199_c0_g3_i1.p1  ORF type:complete len:269 (-),score=52.22 TRINITY_DN2199_c0_g3_i1:21-827(-)